MAFSLANSHILALMVMVLVGINASSTSATQGGRKLLLESLPPDLNAICSKTQNPSICLPILQSYPPESKSSLRDLCNITIDTAHSNASHTNTIIKTVLQHIVDPNVIKALRICSDYYELAIVNLENAKNRLKFGLNREIGVEASDVMGYASSCQDQIGQVSNILAYYNNNLQSFGSIIQVIATMLESQI